MFLSSAVIGVTWLESGFGYDVTISESGSSGNVTWAEASFGYDVEIHAYAYSNWSSYWRQKTVPENLCRKRNNCVERKNDGRQSCGPKHSHLSIVSDQKFIS